MDSNVISKRLEVKPGCVRSVHVRNNRGSWVAKIADKYHCITGDVEDGQFKVDPHYRSLIETYEPLRESRKKNDNKIMIRDHKKKRGSCVYKGEIRRIEFTRKDCLKGRINWKGSLITVQYICGEWISVL